MIEQLVIVGAGGHAKVVIDIFSETGSYDIVGCTGLSGSEVCGYPVVGDDSKLAGLRVKGVTKAFVALGDNQRRFRMLDEVIRLGFEVVNAVSLRAAVSPRASLGIGVAIMPGAVVNVDSSVRDGAIINTAASVDHDCVIGRCAHIGPGSSLAGNVTIGEAAFLGVGVRVIPGVSVGSWTTVGAGGVVIHDIPSRVTAVGIPVRTLPRKNDNT